MPVAEDNPYLHVDMYTLFTLNRYDYETTGQLVMIVEVWFKNL
jgi:hypothetical protein